MNNLTDIDRKPIDLVVIGGYLGAGKTTLLNYVLSIGNDKKVAVLVNDFGAINIDAMLIRSRTEDVINLENGCICCSIGGNLADALIKISARDDRPDLLLIEASGVSDPVKIAQIGMLDKAFRLCAIMVLVDAENIEKTLLDPYVGDVVRRQIAGASALVLTKVDLISDSRKKTIKEHILALAQTRFLFEAANGEIPLEIVFDTAVMPRRHVGLSGILKNKGIHEHSGIRSFSYQVPCRFDRKKLKHVFAGSVVEILRAKGIVWLDSEELPYELHVVGSRMMIVPFRGKTTAESSFVFIGRISREDETSIISALEGATIQTHHQR